MGTMRRWAMLVVLLIGGLLIGVGGMTGCEGWPPVAADSAQLPGGAPGDRGPEGGETSPFTLPDDVRASDHPIDQQAEAIYDSGRALAPILDGPTGGLFSAGLGLAVGVFGLIRGRLQAQRRKQAEQAIREIDEHPGSDPAEKQARSDAARQAIRKARAGG